MKLALLCQVIEGLPKIKYKRILYIFSKRTLKKASQIQSFRILESLVVSKLSFIIYNERLRAFKKALF
jgi:hypothetical protein